MATLKAILHLLLCCQAVSVTQCLSYQDYQRSARNVDEIDTDTDQRFLESLYLSNGNTRQLEVEFGQEIPFRHAVSMLDRFLFPETPEGTMVSCKLRCADCPTGTVPNAYIINGALTDPDQTGLAHITQSTGFDGNLESRIFGTGSIDGINENRVLVTVLADFNVEFTLRCARPEDDDDNGSDTDDNDGNGGCLARLKNAVQSFLSATNAAIPGPGERSLRALQPRLAVISLEYDQTLGFLLTGGDLIRFLLPRVPEDTIVSCYMDCNVKGDEDFFAFRAEHTFVNDGVASSDSGGTTGSPSCFMAWSATAPAPLGASSLDNFYQIDFEVDFSRQFSFQCVIDRDEETGGGDSGGGGGCLTRLRDAVAGFFVF